MFTLTGLVDKPVNDRCSRKRANSEFDPQINAFEGDLRSYYGSFPRLSCMYHNGQELQSSWLDLPSHAFDIPRCRRPCARRLHRGEAIVCSEKVSHGVLPCLCNLRMESEFLIAELFSKCSTKYGCMAWEQLNAIGRCWIMKHGFDLKEF